MSVCMSIRSHISKLHYANLAKFSVRIDCGRGSILLLRQCNTLCTSGFVDDVMVAHNRSGKGYAIWLLSDSPWAAPGQSLMSSSVLFAVYELLLFDDSS